MKNTITTFVFAITILFSFNLTAQYDFQNMNQVLGERKDKQLTMQHATIYVNYMKMTGELPTHASPAQVEAQIDELIITFYLMPRITVNLIENYALEYPETKTSLVSNARAVPVATSSGGNISSNAGGKGMIEQLCDQRQAGHGMDFHSAQAKQIKQILSSAVASRSTSSFSGGGEFYVGTGSNVTIEFCPNGTFTWAVNSNVSGGGGGIGGYDSGSTVDSGQWDVATYNGHNILMMYMPEAVQEVGTDLIPIPIESIGYDHISILEDNYRLTANAASCW